MGAFNRWRTYLEKSTSSERVTTARSAWWLVAAPWQIIFSIFNLHHLLTYPLITQSLDLIVRMDVHTCHSDNYATISLRQFSKTDNMVLTKSYFDFIDFGHFLTNCLFEISEPQSHSQSCYGTTHYTVASSQYMPMIIKICS